MADERPPIQGQGGEEFERAAERVLRRATKAVTKAEQAAEDVSSATQAVRRRARRIAQQLSVETTDAGRFYVAETTPSGGGEVAKRQGRARPSYFRSQEAAEGELKQIAMERSLARERERAGAAVERTETRKTRATQKGTQARVQAARQEAQVVAGNAQEFERIAAQHAARMARALDPEQRAAFEKASAPLTNVRNQEAAARQLADAAQTQRRRTELQPRATAGGGGRDVVRYLADQEAEADRRVSRQREKLETDRLVRAAAREANAKERAAQAEEERVRQGQRTGQDIIRHPELFGQRQAGPLGVTPPGLRTRTGPEFVPPTPEGETRQQIQQFRQAARENARAAREAQRAPAAIEDTPERVQLYEQAMRTARTESTGFEQELQRLTRVQALSGDQMRRHGLLTTEFLEALRAGRTDIREVGTQIGGTIAKFGGWTAAASLTYGMLSAVDQLGQGAIASMQGVTDLSRVVTNLDTGQAQREFRDLSREFNLPIEDVTAAAFEASKAFRTQREVELATQASLYGVKIGELEPAEAAKYPVAIARGFKLQATDLIDVIDVLNQTQNRFGADFGQTMQGVAAAAGAFGAAGGQVNELTSFIATGALVTGKSANEIATALRRTAEIIGRPERRQSIIDVLGIDPSTNSVTAVLERAQQAVSQGADPATIARAITTPELASGRIIPILRSQALYQQISAEATRAHGSAQRELATVLGGVREQLGAVGTNLQRVGAALAESGALAGFGVMLRVLNVTLTTAERLLDVFGLFPQPLRDAAAVGGQLLAMLALARRFNAGGLFPEGGRANRFLARDPERLRRAEVLQGLADERSFVVPERQRSAITASRLQYRAERQTDVVRQLADADQLEGSVESRRALVNAQGRLNRLNEQLVEETVVLNDLTERHTQLQHDENDFRRSTTRRQGESVDAAAARLGIAYGSPIDSRPTPQQPIPVGPNAAGATAASTRAAQRAVVADARATSGAYRTAYARSIGRATTTGTLTGVAALGARASAAGAGAAATARNLATQGSRLASSLAAAVGPFELALAGVLGTYGAIQAIEDATKRHVSRIDAIRRAPLGPDLDKNAREIEKTFDSASWFDKTLDTIARAGLAPLGVGAQGPATPRQTEASEKRLAEEWNERLRAMQSQERGLSRDEIWQRYQGRVRAGDPSATDQALESAQSARGLIGARHLLQQAKDRGAGKKELDQLRLMVKRAQEDVKTFVERVNNDARTREAIEGDYDKSLNLEQLGAVNSLRIRRTGPNRKVVAGSARVLQERIRDANLITNPIDRAKAFEEIDAAREEIEKALADELEKEIDRLTGSPRGGRALRRDYIASVRRLRVAPIRANLRRQGRTTDDLQGQLDQELEARGEGQQGQAADQPRGGSASTLARARARRVDLRRRIKQSQGREKALSQELRRTEKDISDLEREQNRQQFESERSYSQLVTTVRSARLPGGVTRAKYELQRAGQIVRRAIELFGRGSREALQAIADQQSAQDAVAQAQLNLIDARGELAASQQPTDSGRQAAQVNALRQRLAAQQANPRTDPADILRTQAQINEAARSMAEQASQDAAALIEAQFNYRSSLTDNPVELAKLEEQKANAMLHRGGLTEVERLNALADRNRAQRDREKAVSDRRLEDIEYQHDIGKLTDDAYIQAMQRVLQTMKKGSEARRQLRMQIGRAKHEMEEGSTDLDLDVGNIRLPSPYEVHRALKEGRRAAQQSSGLNVTSNPTVNLYLAPGDDGSQVVTTLDNYLKTSARSVLRAGQELGV